MSYSPINGQVFALAFDGAMAGMTHANRVQLQTASSSYLLFSQFAGVWAQAFDIAWNSATAIDEVQAMMISQGSYGEWEDRNSQNLPSSQQPATFVPQVMAIIASIVAAEVYFTAQGITPPVWGGGGVTPPQPTAAGQIPTSTAAGLNNYTWDLPGGFAISTFSKSGGVSFEVGNSDVSPTFTASYNELPDSANIVYSGVGSPLVLITPFTSGQILQTFTSTLNGAAFAFTLHATKGIVSKTAVLSDTFANPILFDVSNTASILATQGYLDTMRADHAPQLHTAIGGTYGALTVGAGQNFAIAYPTAFTLTQVKDSNGFIISPVTIGTIPAYVNPYSVTIGMTLITCGGQGIGSIAFTLS
jgi:hypothetical protein